MKTKHVRPKLVEIEHPFFGCICKNSIQTFIWTIEHVKYDVLNTLVEYKNTKFYELVFISLENEKIEVNEKYLVKWGTNIVGDDLFEISTCTKIGIGGIHYFDEMSMCFGEHEVKEKIKKIIARHSQISPKYLFKFIEQYNDGCVEDLEIETIETYDWSLGEDAINFPIGFKPKLTNGFVTIVEKCKT